MRTAVEAVTVGELMRLLTPSGAFELVAGPHGLAREIRQRTIQRLGVALTGYTDHLEHDRVQMIGRAEGGYLLTLPPDERRNVLARAIAAEFPALVVTAGLSPSVELVELADKFGVALILTRLDSTPATDTINGALTRMLAARETRHSVLLDVFGVGVLLIGKSGIGKSEVALELISAGHRLVADDAVLLVQESPRSVVGACPALTRHHIEIRGLGILNVKDLFGAASVRERKRVELVAEMVEWDPHAEYDRLGLDERFMTLAGVRVPHITLPVRPGRSLRLILEIAARDRLLRAQGNHSARRFADRLDAHLADQGQGEVDDPEEARSE